MSMVTIGDQHVDSDVEDVWYCDKCEEWNFEDDDCKCGEVDEYAKAVTIN